MSKHIRVEDERRIEKFLLLLLLVIVVLIGLLAWPGQVHGVDEVVDGAHLRLAGRPTPARANVLQPILAQIVVERQRHVVHAHAVAVAVGGDVRNEARELRIAHTAVHASHNAVHALGVHGMHHVGEGGVHVLAGLRVGHHLIDGRADIVVARHVALLGEAEERELLLAAKSQQVGIVDGYEGGAVAERVDQVALGVQVALVVVLGEEHAVAFDLGCLVARVHALEAELLRLVLLVLDDRDDGQREQRVADGQRVLGAGRANRLRLIGAQEVQCLVEREQAAVGGRAQLGEQALGLALFARQRLLLLLLLLLLLFSSFTTLAVFIVVVVVECVRVERADHVDANAELLELGAEQLALVARVAQRGGGEVGEHDDASLGPRHVVVALVVVARHVQSVHDVALHTRRRSHLVLHVVEQLPVGDGERSRHIHVRIAIRIEARVVQLVVGVGRAEKDECQLVLARLVELALHEHLHDVHAHLQVGGRRVDLAHHGRAAVEQQDERLGLLIGRHEYKLCYCTIYFDTADSRTKLETHKKHNIFIC